MSTVISEISEGKTTINFKVEQYQSFSDAMLRFPLREYVINKIKAPIMNMLIQVAKRLPVPTRENCHHPNTLVWMDILDRFMEMEDNPGREELFKAINKIFLSEHEHDHSYYGVRIDVILELWLDEVLKGNYKPRSLDYPNICWKSDPNIRGEGFKLIQKCYEAKKRGEVQR